MIKVKATVEIINDNLRAKYDDYRGVVIAKYPNDVLIVKLKDSTLIKCMETDIKVIAEDKKISRQELSEAMAHIVLTSEFEDPMSKQMFTLTAELIHNQLDTLLFGDDD